MELFLGPGNFPRAGRPPASSGLEPAQDVEPAEDVETEPWQDTALSLRRWSPSWGS